MKTVRTLSEAFKSGDDAVALHSMESKYRNVAYGLLSMFENGRMDVEKLDDALRCVGYSIMSLEDAERLHGAYKHAMQDGSAAYRKASKLGW